MKEDSVKRKIFVLVLGMILVLPASLFLSGGAYADGEGGDNLPPIPLDWEESPGTTPPPDVELPMADDEPPLPPIEDDINHTIPGIPDDEEIEPEMPELITPAIPDLVVSEMTLAEGTVPLGTDAELHVILENVGVAYMEETEVAYYLNEISAGTLLTVETAYFEEFSTEQMVFLGMNELGVHSIVAVIDPYDSVAEVRENNNDLTISVEVVSIDSLATDAISQIEVLRIETTNLLGAKKGKAIIAHLNFIENKLADAVSFYDSGNIAQTVNAINNAVDRAFLVVEKYESLYLRGYLDESQAVDLMLTVEDLTKTMITTADIAIDTPTSYTIAAIEQAITELRTEGTIQAMGNVYWDEIDNELAVVLNYYQTAMFKLAKGQDADVFLDSADAALIALIEVIETYGAEGWISPELADWSVGKIEDARAISPPDLTLEPADIHIDALASLGKTNVLTVKVWNTGGVDANDVTVTVYDETEDVEIGSATITTIPNEGYGEADVYWTPTQNGTHYVHVFIDPEDTITESEENNNDAKCGFFVCRGTEYVDDVYVPPTEIWMWNATTIPSLEVVVSGNITIDGFLFIRDDVNVIMNCTFDNQYRIQVNDNGVLDAENAHFVSPSSTLTYSFIVEGYMDLFWSTVQWVWGYTGGNIWDIGGIRLYSNDTKILGSQIFEGKTHGVFVGYGISPDIIFGNTIRDNPVTGICYDDASGGTIESNKMLDNTFGIYCYKASPTIKNSVEISGNSRGIHCEEASPIINGNILTDNSPYGIYFKGASTSIVSSNTIEKNSDYGIRVHETYGISPTIQSNPSISNSTYGVYAYQSSPEIDGNTLLNNSAIGIMADNSASLITRNTLVKNNYSVEHYQSPAGLVTSWNTIRDSYCGVYSYGSTGRIENNTEIVDNDYGVYLQESPDVVVENNVINNHTHYGIIANLSERTTIRNCSMENNSWGVRFFNSSFSSIMGNCTIIGYNGTYSSNSSNIEIRDSTIRDGDGYGIYFTGTTFSTIDNCTVENKEKGVLITSSSHNIQLSNSTVSSNKGYGIYLLTVNNVTIFNSRVMYNNVYPTTNTPPYKYPGLWIHRSRDSIVNGCEVESNGKWSYGLFLDRSTNITVVDNKLNDNNWINLYVYGNEKSHYDHNIDPSNTVGGRPVYYFFDLKDLIIEKLEGGHFTFAWCDNITARYCNSTPINPGISFKNADPVAMIHCSNSRIEASQGYWATYGIMVSKSLNITVSKVRAWRCYIGINVEGSQNTTIISSWGKASYKGIRIYSSDRTRLWNCTSGNSGMGYPFAFPWNLIRFEGTRIEHSSFVTLENHTAVGGDSFDVGLIGRGRNITILNTTTGYSVFGFKIIGTYPNTTIKNSRSISNNYGLYAADQTGCSISNLTISNYTAKTCRAASIYLKNVIYANISVANLTNENLRSGVLIYDSSFVHLEDIDVLDHQYGIRVELSDNISLERCKALNWVGPGGPPGLGKANGDNQIQSASITTYGIRLKSSTNTKIGNSTVGKNSYGISFIESCSNITIFNATMSKNNYSGIYLSSSWDINGYDLKISEADETGVRSFDSTLNITNSTISASTLYDFYLDQNSNTTTLNTTFNKALVHIDTESTLTVRWFMHVHVVDSNLDAVDGATVVVEDVNDILVFTGTSAADGTSRWIKCTEYIQTQLLTTFYSPYNVSASNLTLQGWAMPEPPMEISTHVYVMLGAEIKTHGPIRINSNMELVAQAAAENWPGSGRAGNPYIIWNYDIDGTGYGNCIYIGNTTDHFIIKNCYVHDASGGLSIPYHGDIGLYLHNATNGVIVNNIVSSNDWLGIGVIESSSNNVVQGNNITSNGEGIRLDWYSNNNVITKNTVSENYWGIFNLGMSNDNIIADNTVYNGDVGISIAEWSTGNTVKNNLVYSNQHMAIALSVDAYDNLIEANTISLSQEGIHLNYSDDNEIIGNTISDCSYYGIYFHHSNNNTIANNTISNNNYGMNVTLFSNNNLIYHNNFLFNTNQAYDDCNNFWNASVPAEGNYWSDFATNPGFPIEYRIPGGGNIDYLPSTNPWP